MPANAASMRPAASACDHAAAPKDATHTAASAAVAACSLDTFFATAWASVSIRAREAAAGDGPSFLFFGNAIVGLSFVALLQLCWASPDGIRELVLYFLGRLAKRGDALEESPRPPRRPRQGPLPMRSEDGRHASPAVYGTAWAVMNAEISEPEPPKIVA